MTGPPQNLVVGGPVPPLERTIELPDMVAYAGATWDWHRLHYDPAYLAAKRLPAPVVDGQMFGALLVEQLQDWLGPRARVRTLHFRFKNMVFAGETVRCVGTVTGLETLSDPGADSDSDSDFDPDPDPDPDSRGGSARSSRGGVLVTVEQRVEVVADGRIAVAPAGATVEVR